MKLKTRDLLPFSRGMKGINPPFFEGKRHFMPICGDFLHGGGVFVLRGKIWRHFAGGGKGFLQGEGESENDYKTEISK